MIELLSLNTTNTVPQQLFNFAQHVRWFNFYFGTPLSILLTSAVIWLALLLLDLLTRWPEELLLADTVSKLKAAALSAARRHLWKLFSLLLYLPLLLLILCWTLATLLWQPSNAAPGFPLEFATQFFYLDLAVQCVYPLVEIFLLLEILLWLSLAKWELHIAIRLIIGSAVYSGLGYWIHLLLIYGMAREYSDEVVKLLVYSVFALLALLLLNANRRLSLKVEES